MEKKPGYKTSEFWFMVAASITGLLFASDAFGVDGVMYKILGASSTFLAALGYGVIRTIQKK